MALQQVIEQTVQGLGYDLVEIERSAGGLLRVTIDMPWSPPVAIAVQEQEAGADAAPVAAEYRHITVEDCEKVTRQLQFALEVDGAEYARLEVSSPGIDRLLRSELDLSRFVGSVVDVALLAPIGVAAAQGVVNANRKKFRGVLEAGSEAGAWQVLWSDEPERKPGVKVSKKYVPAPLQSLGFTLDEVKEVRLAPIVSFKGRAS